MKVLANNCVSEIKVPGSVGKAHMVDYSPALGLCATSNNDNGVLAVWDPESRNVIAIFEDVGECCDTLFVPGDRLAVSSSPLYIGGAVDIYTFDKKESKPAKFTIEGSHDSISLTGALALSPNKTLLLTDAFGFGVYELVIDWNDLKVIKSEEIDLGKTDEEIGEEMLALCCSPDFKVATYTFTSGHTLIRMAKVCFNSDGKKQEEEQETITYYMLDGKRRDLSNDGNLVRYGLVHDGEHLIIANRDEIVLLESMTEGSNAYLIASNIAPSEGQMRINHEGQLMVCEDTVIKLFEYKCNPRTLRALCRQKIRKTIRTDYREKVNNFKIPNTLKDYLLYK